MAVDNSYAAADGSSSAPAFAFNSAPTTGMYLDGSGNIVFTKLGSPVAKVTASGMTGNVSAPVTLSAATQTLKAAQSGQMFVAAVDAVFTLPLASTMPGGTFTIVTGAASSGTGVVVTAAAGDIITAKTFPGNATGVSVAITTATGGSITNTGASDVVWDRVTLRSDGVTHWYAVEQSGIWA